jgi:hypothetical protein
VKEAIRAAQLWSRQPLEVGDFKRLFRGVGRPPDEEVTDELRQRFDEQDQAKSKVSAMAHDKIRPIAKKSKKRGPRR